MPNHSPALAWLLGAASPTPASGDFDERVSEVRRHMRSSCQALQALPKAQEAERARLTETAASNVAEALGGWGFVVRDFARRIPEGYAGDPAWAARLEDVRLLLGRMQREIGAGEHRAAFLSRARSAGTW